MPSSKDIYKKINSIQTQLDGMTPVDAGAILREFMGRVDNFRPQYETLADLENDAYSAAPSEMDKYNKIYGGVGGVTAMNRLSNTMKEIGRRYGSADTMSRVIDTQKGRIQDLADQAVNMYGQQRQSLLDQYNAQTPLLQAALSREEAAAARASQAAQAAKALELEKMGMGLSSQSPKTPIIDRNGNNNNGNQGGGASIWDAIKKAGDPRGQDGIISNAVNATPIGFIGSQLSYGNPLTRAKDFAKNPVQGTKDQAKSLLKRFKAITPF